MWLLGGKDQWRPSWRLASMQMEDRNCKFAFSSTFLKEKRNYWRVNVNRKNSNRQISEIQRKSVAGNWPGWKLTDCTNRKTLHPHLSPEYFTTACFYFPTPQWHLRGNREPPLFNVKVFMVYRNRLEGSCLAGALQTWCQPKIKLECTLFLLSCECECAYFRAGRCIRPWLCTLCHRHGLCSCWMYSLLGKERPYTYMYNIHIYI